MDQLDEPLPFSQNWPHSVYIFTASESEAFNIFELVYHNLNDFVLKMRKQLRLFLNTSRPLVLISQEADILF